MIAIESLAFGYPGSGTLFDGLDAAFESGCISALAGPNGTGKSTLLKLVSGLLSPWSGEIRIGGVPVRKMDRIERAKRLAYMAQNPVLPEDWTVPEVLEAGDYPHRRRPPAPSSLEARLHSARRIMALDPFWERPVGTLSGGEAQRVALARALVQDAPLLVLDEPASHLDMRHQVQLYRSLQTLARNGRTILMATHDLNLARLFGCRLFLLDRKRVCRPFPEKETAQARLLEEVFEVPLVSRQVRGVGCWFPDVGAMDESTESHVDERPAEGEHERNEYE